MLKVECEGTDGVGKSTALAYIVEKTRSLGLNIIETREVGNPHVPSCVKMRELVLDPANKMSGEAMELVFSAMRIESDNWLKTVNADLIISDRGFFSHLAYGLHNTSQPFVEGLFEQFMIKQTKLPDIVIYFSVDGETALKRRTKRGEAVDAIEAKGTEFQELVRSSFLSYINKYKSLLKKVYIVDASQDIPGVRQQLDIIINDIRMLLNK